MKGVKRPGWEPFEPVGHGAVARSRMTVGRYGVEGYRNEWFVVYSATGARVEEEPWPTCEEAMIAAEQEHADEL